MRLYNISILVLRYMVFLENYAVNLIPRILSFFFFVFSYLEFFQSRFIWSVRKGSENARKHSCLTGTLWKKVSYIEKKSFDSVASYKSITHWQKGDFSFGIRFGFYMWFFIGVPCIMEVGKAVSCQEWPNLCSVW